MKCPRCQQDIPPVAQFCPKCGAKLPPVWSQCGTANAPSHRFRKQCGRPLAAPPHQAGGVLPPATPAADAERRHLTVMFCDVVGSTALAEKLDPEEMHDIVRAYQHACAGVIERLDG